MTKMFEQNNKCGFWLYLLFVLESNLYPHSYLLLSNSYKSYYVETLRSILSLSTLRDMS
jgi:hypothetical protein